jgi:hypothetical protein
VKKGYCFHSFRFPKEAFLGFIFTIVDGYPLFVPLTYLHGTLADVQKAVSETKRLSKNGKEVKEDIVVFPIVFDRHFPLRKEFWDNPTEDYTVEDRIKSFIELLKNEQFIEILITPLLGKKGKVKFHTACCFTLGTPKSTVDNFMLKSNHPVETSAKYAAFYRPKTPFILNLNTGKTSPIAKPSPVQTNQIIN